MQISMNVNISSNTNTLKKDVEEKIQKALKAIGLQAETHAKENCPVDTGRLRNSITFATVSYQSPANTNKHPNGQADAEPSDYRLQGTPEKHEVVVGTNVEYAPDVEYRDIAHRTGKAHFLRDSMDKHKKEFKDIIDAAMKS